MTTAARPPASAPRPGAAVPIANCTADTAGGLTFDVVLPGLVERWDAALLLHGAGVAEPPVRLPLVPLGDGALRAVLPSTMRMSEGRWKASLVLGDEPPKRLRSGRHDLRSLVARIPRTGRTWLGVRIPYRTQGGGLCVRAWQRWPHAEAGELRVAHGVMALRGRLHGTVPADGARLEARTREGDALALSAPVHWEGQCFAAELPLHRLARATAAREGWLLWLRPAAGASAVRVARILDDLVDKRHALRYPAVALPGLPAVRPCYTGDNDLAVRWEDPPPDSVPRTGTRRL